MDWYQWPLVEEVQLAAQAAGTLIEAEVMFAQIAAAGTADLAVQQKAGQLEGELTWQRGSSTEIGAWGLRMRLRLCLLGSASLTNGTG